MRLDTGEFRHRAAEMSRWQFESGRAYNSALLAARSPSGRFLFSASDAAQEFSAVADFRAGFPQLDKNGGG